MPAHPAPSVVRSGSPHRAAPFLVLALVGASAALPAVSLVGAAEVPDHLVVSEVVTGGASASDELVELYNPTSSALPLEGLELVYVSASGATVTRRASWAAGAPSVPAHGHLLLANDLGLYAPIADVLYTGGMAATGGSVAIRIQGASTPIDALGWGTATNAWMEVPSAPAPGAGESLERLPGGAAGSTVDTEANAADFVVRSLPDPQNLGSPPTPELQPPTPAPPTPEPTGPIVTPAPTPAGTPSPSATPSVAVVSIAAARTMPDGAIVTVEGVSLTDSAFADGGGYLADDGAGIAVLPDGETFPRGRTLRVTGEIDDRFGQRTLRVGVGGIVDLGTGIDPGVSPVTTGAVGESVEGRLVRIAATLQGPASTLTSGVAFDVDDGSGPSRLVVGTATGIDVATWGTGTRIDLVGVVGQRDSTGTGTTGYRVQPRDGADLLLVEAPATPTPGPSGAADPSATPNASAPPEEGIQTIGEARSAPRNARVRIQGTVTLPTGVVDPQTAAVQDATGAILLRLSDEAGALRRGQRVDIIGTRSTKSGMETIRVTTAPQPLGTADEPTPVVVGTGAAGEAHEAQLVVVRGGLVASARRASSGTVSMEIDDGSGPLRVVVGASLELDRALLTAGTWIEVRGVLGQETTGAQPLRGYRVWPAALADLRVTAGATEADAAGTGGEASTSEGSGPAIGGLDDLGSADAGAVTVGATLVAGHWPELGLAGVLWDGERLVGLAAADTARVAAAIGKRRPPVPLELHGLRGAGDQADPGIALAKVADGGEILPADRPAAAPATARPGPDDPPAWYAVVGRLEGPPASPRIRAASGTVSIDRRCAGADPLPRGLVTASGIAVPGRDTLVVGCGGIAAGSHLDRALDAGSLGASAVEAGDARPAAEVASTEPTVTLLVAALLASASLVLGGLAAWSRWGPADPDPAAADTRSPSDDEPGDGPAEPAPAPPVLTLVPLPRERSP